MLIYLVHFMHLFVCFTLCYIIIFSSVVFLLLLRILAMRLSFREKLEAGMAGMAARGIPADQQPSWKHVTDQIGMFCYTGLTLEQVHTVKTVHF